MGLETCRALFPAESSATTSAVTTRATLTRTPTATPRSTATGPTVTRATTQPTAPPVSVATQSTARSTARTTVPVSGTATGPITSKHHHPFPQRGCGHAVGAVTRWGEIGAAISLITLCSRHLHAPLRRSHSCPGDPQAPGDTLDPKGLNQLQAPTLGLGPNLRFP